MGKFHAERKAVIGSHAVDPIYADMQQINGFVMRIGFVIDVIAGGGVERRTVNLANALSQDPSVDVFLIKSKGIFDYLFISS